MHYPAIIIDGMRKTIGYLNQYYPCLAKFELQYDIQQTLLLRSTWWGQVAWISEGINSPKGHRKIQNTN
jgi:hypothetical protein